MIDSTAYFYDLPITVQNGHIYTLPMTGGSGFPFAPLGMVMLLVGFTLYVVKGKSNWVYQVRKKIKQN